MYWSLIDHFLSLGKFSKTSNNFQMSQLNKLTIKKCHFLKFFSKRWHRKRFSMSMVRSFQGKYDVDKERTRNVMSKDTQFIWLRSSFFYTIILRPPFTLSFFYTIIL